MVTGAYIALLCSVSEGADEWGEVAAITEVLHAIVSYDHYCKQLLESGMQNEFMRMLRVLESWPAAQLTFAACLARLAVHEKILVSLPQMAPDTGSVHSKAAKPGRQTDIGRKMAHDGTLDAICSVIVTAVQVKQQVTGLQPLQLQWVRLLPD